MIRTAFWAVLTAGLLAALTAPAAEADKKTTETGVESKPAPKKKVKPTETATSSLKEKGWEKLFDGKTLYGWKEAEFVGHNEVKVEDGKILMLVGDDITGITYTNEVLRMNYEVYLEAARIDGSDFFCALTFPVGKDPCSLIVGGWGGGLVGLSSLDGSDASQNETTSYRSFETGKWYHIRLRVTSGQIEAWIEDDKVVDVKTTGRTISIRIEVERSRPFGIATYRTTGAIRDIRWRQLESPAEAPEPKDKK